MDSAHSRSGLPSPMTSKAGAQGVAQGGAQGVASQVRAGVAAYSWAPSTLNAQSTPNLSFTWP